MSGFGNDFNFSRMISARNESRSSAASFCRSEEHTSELQSQSNLVCRLLLEKKKQLARLLLSCLLPGHSQQEKPCRHSRLLPPNLSYPRVIPPLHVSRPGLVIICLRCLSSWW